MVSPYCFAISCNRGVFSVLSLYITFNFISNLELVLNDYRYDKNHRVMVNVAFGGDGATRPLPRDRGLGGISRKPNSRATPQSLDPKSKMEEVMPKMARRRGSDARQSKKR